LVLHIWNLRNWFLGIHTLHFLKLRECGILKQCRDIPKCLIGYMSFIGNVWLVVCVQFIFRLIANGWWRNATISCKISVKIGPVVSAENILIEIALCVHVVVWRISLNISGFTGPIFTNFSPYERALRTDDGSVPYFPISQGSLPWKPNNFAIMKANYYDVHSLHIRQMVARFWFATTC